MSCQKLGSGESKRSEFFLVALVLSVIIGIPFVFAIPAFAQMGVPSFSQNDPAWRYQRLGYSNLTIGAYGCALTSTADVLRYHGVNTNPADLNAFLQRNGGFSGAAIIWSSAARRGPGVVWVGAYYWTNVAADTSVLDYWLDRGQPVIVETRIGSSRNQQHFVVLTGRSGYTYFINDPIDGARTTFNGRYGDPRRWIYGARVYRRA